MDALLEAIGKLLGNFKDNTQIVLLLVCFAQGYFIYSMRKEHREDIGKFADAAKSWADAVNGLKNLIAAITGKAS